MSQKDRYEYLNLDQINELADGDNDFLEELISTCLESIPANLDKLVAAVNDKDTNGILFYAHKLKGSFNFIGTTQLAETFVLMEENAKDTTKYSMMSEWLAEVVRISGKTMSELEDLQSKLPKK